MKTLVLIPLLLFLVSACSTEATKPIQFTMQMTNTGPLELTTALRLLGTTSPRVRSPWLAA
jgi:hypothetical protein